MPPVLDLESAYADACLTVRGNTDYFDKILDSHRPHIFGDVQAYLRSAVERREPVALTPDVVIDLFRQAIDYYLNPERRYEGYQRLMLRYGQKPLPKKYFFNTQAEIRWLALSRAGVPDRGNSEVMHDKKLYELARINSNLTIELKGVRGEIEPVMDHFLPYNLQQIIAVVAKDALAPHPDLQAYFQKVGHTQVLEVARELLVKEGDLSESAARDVASRLVNTWIPETINSYLYTSYTHDMAVCGIKALSFDEFSNNTFIHHTWQTIRQMKMTINTEFTLRDEPVTIRGYTEDLDIVLKKADGTEIIISVEELLDMIV